VTAVCLSARPITRLLERAPAPVFVAYAITVSFSTYFCMYAFRKPFAAASFEGQTFLSGAVELKSAIIISQIVGYALSKYIGVKVCSEVSARRRAVLLVALIAWAFVALVLFGLVPGDWKVAAIFFNGLPLGMVWGLVVLYLEGRRSSELLLAGLSCSFIVSSGIVKDVGRALMSGLAAERWATVPWIGPPVAGLLGHIDEAWMPAVTGLHFLPLFLLSVWLLDQIPVPTAADVAERSKREPMDSRSRRDFVRQHLLGIALLVVAYFFLTAYRDFRDNFAVEIFDGLGYPYAGNETVISRAEAIVALGVMLLLAALNGIRDNRRGLAAAFVLMTGGCVLLAGATGLLEAGWISGFWWMTLVGLGSYLAYVPYGSVLFDRLFASTGAAGTAVFAIYVADAAGYTGSVGTLLYKDLFESGLSRLAFFKAFSWGMAGVGSACLVTSCLYFLRQSPRRHVGRSEERGSRAREE